MAVKNKIAEEDIELPQKGLKKQKTLKPAKKVIDISKVERYAPKEKTGLNDSQVFDRFSQGLVNVDRSKKGKSTAQIIFSNIFTFFNLIYIVVSAILIYYAQYKQLTFLSVVLANTLIAIVQEIRSKKSLEKLNLVSLPMATVIRNGKQVKVPVGEVVLDDIITYTTGSQIIADSIVVSGAVEANEAILTGESEAVFKQVGDVLYAGSYVVSNNCVAKVDKVGKFNYIEKLTGKARKYKKPHSQLLKSFNIILYFIAVILPPLAYFMWQVNSMASGDFMTTLLNTVSPVVAIIPAGPFLLTSVTLAISVIRLAKNKTMVQELYCIEMLARVNTLCLDKTGTITDGTMKVIECVDLRLGGDRYSVGDIVGAMQNALGESNSTARALTDYFDKIQLSGLKKTTVVPFSSARKFSAVSFEGNGTYFLGAPEFILNTSGRVDDLVRKFAERGCRVLLLAHSSSSIFVSDKSGVQLPLIRKPVAVIVLEDHIREDAADTFRWFKLNGVDIKVISGDNPLTVSNIAAKADLNNYDKYISLDGVSDEEIYEIADKYTVFGRVSPDQKAVLIKALQSKRRTVAMTGDGVNDILALREADTSIAMASGSDAARNVSHLVLMDDNFSSLPKVVAEGRRVVNNIQNASSMFFMKTVYTIALMMFIIIMDIAFSKSYYYPYKMTNILML
ncbi:MAG TPA: HAD-IC family P-type ATPase, partial [Eubacteriales bacterium]|nr:HAD-IC family P-type ATPase [Eubacteriales bacterium]